MALMLKSPGWFTFQLLVCEHPLASVTVTWYTPAARLLMSAVEAVNPPGPVQACP